ncbi:nucleoside deaminase [Desulfovibrio sp. OttesenSCG-928-G15]|nr:nucleoside deaminase [Desulfovibrio sp. OttesenSCG-928-G15]
MTEALFTRILDVIECDIVPRTAKAVETGSKVFGAAVIRKSDLSLVLAETNHEAFSPLWHGEVYTIKMFYEKQGHPDPADCIFISTHQPCCMCASALAWSGFREIYYLFGYQDTKDAFNIPHDMKMIRELFGTDTPAPSNAYFSWQALADLADAQPDPQAAKKRLQDLAKTYAKLSEVYQAGEKRMVLT